MTIRDSAFDVVTARTPGQVTTKAELLDRVRELERAALEQPPVAFAVACLQDARFLTAATTRIYAELAARGAQALVLGRGVRAHVAPGVLGIDLADDDPLGDEWTVLLAGRSFTCFVARDLHDAPLEDDARSFEWACTDDPDLVANAYEVLAQDITSRAAVELTDPRHAGTPQGSSPH